MPYTVIDDAEGCSGYAVVKEGENTPVPGGCHDSKQDAIDHMVALEIATQDEQRADSSANIVEKEGQRTDMEAEQDNAPRSVIYPLEGRRIGGRDVEFREMPVTIDSVDTAEGDMPMTFRGYAAVFDSPSEPLPFVETIASGAFKRSLNSGREVRMFINHNSDQVLASTRSGTLTLAEDERGLFVEAQLPPTTHGRDLSVLMQRGDVHSMSFGFSVPSGGDSWSEDGQSRELREVILHEVSVVTGFPAYPATSGANVRHDDEESEQRDDESADTQDDASLPLSIAQRLFDLNAKRTVR